MVIAVAIVFLAACGGGQVVEEKAAQDAGSERGAECSDGAAADGPKTQSNSDGEVDELDSFSRPPRDVVLLLPPTAGLCYTFSKNQAVAPSVLEELWALKEQYALAQMRDAGSLFIVGEADADEDDPDALSLARAQYVANLLNEALATDSEYWNSDEPVEAIGVGARTGYTHCPFGDMDHHRVAYWPNSWELDAILDGTPYEWKP